jgi:ADP-ribosylglycohydrolase
MNNDSITQKQQKYRGSLLGLACGDALGTTLEFKKPSTFNPINDMIGGGPFKLEPGQWTDDTSSSFRLFRTSVLSFLCHDPRI